MKFEPFPKMARLLREVQITEKIDGTNASIFISNAEGPNPIDSEACAQIDDLIIYAGSRTRWITPSNDNFGFARWVCEHAEELIHLGHGHHFGEWWGSGIQRGYGLQKGEKRFSLFNSIRWCRHDCDPEIIQSADPRVEKRQEKAPECCSVVPVLYWGLFSEKAIQDALSQLKNHGSKAAPGFMNPEGIVTYHRAAGIGFKTTLEGDSHKG